jgi:hypothetical protein
MATPQLTTSSLLVLPQLCSPSCTPAHPPHRLLRAPPPAAAASHLQAHAKVPEDAWEYQIRKALNDAAYNGLDYVPYSSTMPVQPKDDSPKWMWKKKGAK